MYDWMRMTHRLLAALVVAAAGCTSPLAPADAEEVRGVRFEMVQDEYAPGDFAEYRLINGSSDHYTYNFCFAVLTRADEGKWVVAGSGGACATIGYGLAPGGAVSSGEQLPADLPSGWYRFTMGATGGNVTCPPGGCPQEYLHTETFRVDPTP